MKQPVSDIALGAFLLSCATLSLEATRLAKEINKMTAKLCSECHGSLTDEEIKEGKICDKCLDKLQNDEYEKRKHPDDNSGKFRVN